MYPQPAFRLQQIDRAVAAAAAVLLVAVRGRRLDERLQQALQVLRP